jgi:aromatic ring-opening dioxygenase LigB subunit
MGIIGAFILPHGAMVLDEKKAKKHQALELHNAMKQIAQEIKDLKPDIIFLTSPHGISHSNDFGIYLNQAASCSAEWDGDFGNYSCEIPIDKKLSEELLEYLLDKETAVSGIVAYAPSFNIPLRWGEAVPLWFLKDIPASFVIMSQPTKRYDMVKELIPETLTLGNDLRLFFEDIEKRIVIIISADLAHTHQKKGPYGFDESAAIFDNLIGEWANTLNDKILLKQVISKLERAKVCGYIGFILLQGMLGKLEFTPKLVVNKAPTYYGMMVAQFKREK